VQICLLLSFCFQRINNLFIFKKGIFMKMRFALAAACSLLAISPATAATIGNIGSFDSTLQIDFFSPVGQSFVAVDSALTSIGFGYNVINSGFPVTPITIDLYAGAGTGGSIIATRTFSLSNPNAVFDTDFTGTALTIGQVYTAALSAAGSPFQGVHFSGSDTFAAGQAFSPNLGVLQCGNGGCDLEFRVTGTSGPSVPEPATWAMLLTGFGLAGAAMRRKSRATVLA
jgi:PEP-CTERM motif